MSIRLFALAILFASLFTKSRAQDIEMYYVHFNDGRVWGYPKEFVKSIEEKEGGYTFVLEGDSLISWTAEQIVSVDDIAPAFPQFTEFKLDDKLNDQLFRDVEATVTPSEVVASVSGIGKYLTPLFSMNMPEALAYVRGEEQYSGSSRLRFENEVVYTLQCPGHQRLSLEIVNEEVWSDPDAGVVEIPLTVEMLSTNAPTSFVNEGLGMMLDGDPSTFFHSTWSKDPVYDVDLSKQVYVSVALPYGISELKFYYKGRQQSGYNIEEWRIEASNDGKLWNNIATIDESMGVPTSGSSVYYTSDAISLGSSYRYVRFVAAKSQYKNYLCLSEFRLYEVCNQGDAPELLHPAKYVYHMLPMGREVPVRIKWLTDEAKMVPCININVEDGTIVTSKEDYLKAEISFVGNGVWDDYDFQGPVKIKGRGNTSWSTPTNNYNPKNPYRLKFDSSVTPFGMKKGKNWNLIAQAQKGSLMTNPVAHKIARMVGMQTANDVIPVELYMNGEYRGSYYFTQKVGMAGNSVDFDDESMAVVIELDSYFEEGQFDSDSYKLPVNIKDPEFGEDDTCLDLYGVKDEFNRFETAVYENRNFERFIDMDMLVRYMLINDLVLNTELGHPKSAYLSRENMGHMASRYVFGPAWDFDWAYGYEGTSSYCTDGATRDLFDYHSGKSGNRFFCDLLRSGDWVSYHYYRLWEEFIDKHLDELIDFIDDYYAYAHSSFVNNSYKWDDGYNYDSNVANMKSWLVQRAHHIKNSLIPYGAESKEPFAYGDLNEDGVVSQTDIEGMLTCLFDMEVEGVQMEHADADANGQISLSDLTWLNLLAEDKCVSQVQSRVHNAVLWDDNSEEEQNYRYDFDIDDMRTLVPLSGDETNVALMRKASPLSELGIEVTELAGKWNAEISLASPVPYIAFSMDFVVPEPFTLSDGDADIMLTYRTENTFVVTGRWITDKVYRVIGYSQDNTAMSDTEGPFFTLSLSSTSSLVAGDYTLMVDNVCVVTENALEEELLGVSTMFEVTKEQMTHIITSSRSALCRPADIFDAHGRLVRKAATSFDGLGKGIYIMNNQKYVR